MLCDCRNSILSSPVHACVSMETEIKQIIWMRTWSVESSCTGNIIMCPFWYDLLLGTWDVSMRAKSKLFFLIKYTDTDHSILQLEQHMDLVSSCPNRQLSRYSLDHSMPRGWFANRRPSVVRTLVVYNLHQPVTCTTQHNMKRWKLKKKKKLKKLKNIEQNMQLPSI